MRNAFAVRTLVRMNSTRQTMRPALRAGLAAFGLGAALMAGACSDSSSASSTGRLQVVATDFAFEIEDRSALRPGLVELSLHNAGSESHQLTLGRLRDGVEASAFEAALLGGGGDPLQLVDFIGGPNHVAPGQAETSFVELESGEYVMICFIPSHDGTPHLVKGMTASFTVDGERRDVEPPAADARVELRDHAVSMPPVVDADAVLAVENDGKEAHELAIIELPDGVSAAEAVQELQRDHAAGNKPTSMPVAGGAAVLSPGQETLVRLDLGAGRYLAVCYVPGAEGKPHFELGMATEFTVR